MAGMTICPVCPNQDLFTPVLTLVVRWSKAPSWRARTMREPTDTSRSSSPIASAITAGHHLQTPRRA